MQSRKLITATDSLIKSDELLLSTNEMAAYSKGHHRPVSHVDLYVGDGGLQYKRYDATSKQKLMRNELTYISVVCDVKVNIS